MRRTAAEESAAARKAYERVRAEADRVRARAAAAKTAEEVAAEYERREAEGGYIDAAGGEEEEVEGGEAPGTAAAGAAGGLLAQASLPSMRDPKLWMLACKEGEEAAICIALVNKAVAREAEGERLGILSAVCTAKG